jgi:SAM-dependent methyltransferase
MKDRAKQNVPKRSSDPDFWEQPEVVDEFAARAADLRLARIIESYPESTHIHVLDLGCAGGRNADFLCARGFDVHALDTSRAMVKRTRQRLAVIVGEPDAKRRVQIGRMQKLDRFPAAHFDLVLALGVYHNASGHADFDGALSETARVLAPAGQVLVAIFSPESAPKGEPLVRASAEDNLYSGFDSGPLYLLEPDELDLAMAGHGLLPAEPTVAARAATLEGFRISVNGLYVKRA